MKIGQRYTRIERTYRYRATFTRSIYTLVAVLKARFTLYCTEREREREMILHTHTFIYRILKIHFTFTYRKKGFFLVPNYAPKIAFCVLKKRRFRFCLYCTSVRQKITRNFEEEQILINVETEYCTLTIYVQLNTELGYFIVPG